MTETLGMTIPQQACRFGSQARNPEGVMNLTRVFVLQALNHRRCSIETSRHRPRRMSSRAMAMTMPVLSSGMPFCAAYETASALPSRASRSFSENGRSWMPLWSTPLLRPLVTSPTRSCCSRTTMRSGLPELRCAISLAMAQPTTPAPTMQTSYVFIRPGPPVRERDQASGAWNAVTYPGASWGNSRAQRECGRRSWKTKLENRHVRPSFE